MRLSIMARVILISNRLPNGNNISREPPLLSLPACRVVCDGFPWPKLRMQSHSKCNESTRWMELFHSWTISPESEVGADNCVLGNLLTGSETQLVDDWHVPSLVKTPLHCDNYTKCCWVKHICFGFISRDVCALMRSRTMQFSYSRISYSKCSPIHLFNTFGTKYLLLQFRHRKYRERRRIYGCRRGREGGGGRRWRRGDIGLMYKHHNWKPRRHHFFLK